MSGANLQTVLTSPVSPLAVSDGKNSFAINHYQPFCADPEGWGPISQWRYDFTPCFLDVYILFVAAWGLLAGAGAVWYLLKTRIPQPVSKNWHFYAKLVGIPSWPLV